MDAFKSLVERANPGFNMNLFEKRGHEGETFVALMRAFPHELFEAAEKYGSIRKFIEAILNGDTWYSTGGNKYTLVPDKPGFLGGLLSFASIALGAVSTFVPVVAPLAAGAAVGASAANSAARKAIADVPFQQQIVLDYLLSPLPGDVLLTGRTDMPPGYYYSADTKAYLYTMYANGNGVYDVKAVGNGLGSTDLKEPGQFDTSGLPKVYLNADGSYNVQAIESNNTVSAVKALNILDEPVSSAASVYDAVTSVPASVPASDEPDGSLPASGSKTVVYVFIALAVIGFVLLFFFKKK